MEIINTLLAPVAADDAGQQLQIVHEVVVVAVAAGRDRCRQVAADCMQADGKVGCSWHHKFDCRLAVKLQLFAVHLLLQYSESLPFQCWLVFFFALLNICRSAGR